MRPLLKLKNTAAIKHSQSGPRGHCRWRILSKKRKRTKIEVIVMRVTESVM